MDRTGSVLLSAVLHLCVPLPCTYNNIPDIRQLLFDRSFSRHSPPLPRKFEPHDPHTTQHAVGNCATVCALVDLVMSCE